MNLIYHNFLEFIPYKSHERLNSSVIFCKSESDVMKEGMPQALPESYEDQHSSAYQVIAAGSEDLRLELLLQCIWSKQGR